MEANSITQVQSSLSQVQMSFLMLKKMQDDCCKPYELEAERYINDMNKPDAGAAGERQDDEIVSSNFCPFCYLSYF